MASGGSYCVGGGSYCVGGCIMRRTWWRFDGTVEAQEFWGQSPESKAAPPWYWGVTDQTEPTAPWLETK